MLVHGSSLIIVMKKGSNHRKKMDEYKEKLPTSTLLLQYICVQCHYICRQKSNKNTFFSPSLIFVVLLTRDRSKQDRST